MSMYRFICGGLIFPIIFLIKLFPSENDRIVHQYVIEALQFSFKNYGPYYTFRISQSRSLISVHWSPKITEIPLYRSDLTSRSLIFKKISVFFKLQCTEIKVRDLKEIARSESIGPYPKFSIINSVKN
jgi:hypothetical protein